MAVTVLTLTNTGAEPTTRTLTAASPIATLPAALGPELTGTVTAPLREPLHANEPLRTGRYGKQPTFTLSTTDAVTIHEEESE